VLTVQLRDKLPAGPAGEGAPAKAAAPAGDGKSRQLHAALVSMGYKASKADVALEKLTPRIAEADLATLLREALAILATA
jgi:Holliday junction resolvasome RuvABC DNA-binding subunit